MSFDIGLKNWPKGRAAAQNPKSHAARRYSVSSAPTSSYLGFGNQRLATKKSPCDRARVSVAP